MKSTQGRFPPADQLTNALHRWEPGLQQEKSKMNHWIPAFAASLLFASAAVGEDGGPMRQQGCGIGDTAGL